MGWEGWLHPGGARVAQAQRPAAKRGTPSPRAGGGWGWGRGAGLLKTRSAFPPAARNPLCQVICRRSTAASPALSSVPRDAGLPVHRVDESVVVHLLTSWQPTPPWAAAGAEQRAHRRRQKGPCPDAGRTHCPIPACSSRPVWPALTRPRRPQQCGDGAGSALHINAVDGAEHPPPRLKVLDHVAHHHAGAAHVNASRMPRCGAVCAAALLFVRWCWRCQLLGLLRLRRRCIGCGCRDRAGSPPRWPQLWPQ